MVRELLYDRTCRCPACRQRLVGLPTAVRRCPRCRRWLEPLAVWRRRRYPGLIEVPLGLLLLAGTAFVAFGVALFFVTQQHPDAGWVAAAIAVTTFSLPWLAMAYALWLRQRPPWPAETRPTHG